MKKAREKALFRGEWLTLKELHYITQNGKNIRWEAIERNNTQKVIVILAKLVPSNRYILIKQFRPPINNWVIAFPAGIAYGQDIQAQAIKELKEETGYTGSRITQISPELAFSPALTNERAQVISIEVDEADPANIDPQQNLEPQEQILVELVHIDHIDEFLDTCRASNIEISAAIWYLFCKNPQ